ncbi:Vacuolar iron transporter homolog 4 [Linum grandiflorum]
MMGVGAVKQDVKVMILTRFVGLIAGACSMALGEFVSVYSHYDIEVAKMKRDKERTLAEGAEENIGEMMEDLPSPSQAALASGLAFSMGAMVPLMAASFIDEYRVRVVVVTGAVTLALVMFGWVGAVLGKAPVVKSSMRVLICGWLAMALTSGLTKLMEMITTHLH